MNSTHDAALTPKAPAGNIGDLVVALADMFCRSEAKERERVSPVFAEVLLHVMDRLEAAARTAIARRVSEEDKVPKPILKALASDTEIEVAEPVLLNSRVLSDEDLAEIAKEVSNAHMLVLCKRHPIRPVLTRVLAESGNPEVLHTLARNHAATLGGDTFDILVARARKDEELQEALSARDDLPMASAEKLVPFLSRELSQRIRDGNLNEVLVKAIATRAAREVEIQLREFNGAKSKTQELIDKALEGQVPVDVAVAAFADKDRAFDLAQLLARKQGWPENVVVPLVFRDDEMPLFVLCRISGVSEEAYSKIIKMRSKRMRLSSSNSAESTRRYAELSVAEARNTFLAMARKLKLPAEV
ncbi:DUF2336 domain-containing protein [Stappia sp. ICDLI1TA098]